jgi:hypothetical protein
MSGTGYEQMDASSLDLPLRNDGWRVMPENPILCDQPPLVEEKRAKRKEMEDKPHISN